MKTDLPRDHQLIHEEFGDGIKRAIDSSIDIEREADRRAIASAGSFQASS